MNRPRHHVRSRTNERLFASTAGKVLALLCHGRCTVDELAIQLKLTDNAVRAQLQRLQRDGLVHAAGSRRGVRRPHVDYDLTAKARRLFPTAYEPVLRELVGALARSLPAAAIQKILADVMQRLARTHAGQIDARTPRKRFDQLIDNVKSCAPDLITDRKSTSATVRLCSCPLASLTASHPELCQLAAATLGKVLQTPVNETCQRDPWPQCRFNVSFSRR
jgi:predicted ArsR family transcriptional regulator